MNVTHCRAKRIDGAIAVIGNLYAGLSSGLLHNLGQMRNQRRTKFLTVDIPFQQLQGQPVAFLWGYGGGHLLAELLNGRFNRGRITYPFRCAVNMGLVNQRFELGNAITFG